MHRELQVLEGIETRYGLAPTNPVALLGKFRPATMSQADFLAARSGHAATGMLSNTFDQLEATLAHGGRFRDPFQKRLMHKVLFMDVKQGPISAAKAKRQGAKPYDLADLMGWRNRLMQSLEDRAGAEEFWQTLYEGADRIMDKETYRQHLTARKQWYLDVHADFSTTRAAAVRTLQASPEAVEQMVKRGGPLMSHIGQDMLALQSVSGGPAQRAAESAIGHGNATLAGVRAGARRVGDAAQDVTNATLKSVERVAQSATGHGAGKTLLVGAAIAAGAGLLFGSIRSPREGQALAPSGNRHRPEERIGVDGHIPGEPTTGAMAAANPPRTMRADTRGVRTAVVAPIHHNTNLEVRMRTEDQGRAQELAKHLAQMSSSGESQVTINYRDANRANSLRSQERIRETLERD